jgi:heterodisulfide reductase subunit C
MTDADQSALSQQEEDSFIDEVIAATHHGERLRTCLQCGTCGGSCPNGSDMDHTPRAIFALIAANRRDDVLSSNTPWKCVSCYLCTSRCPKQIPITEIMYTLKRISGDEGYADNDARALARNFNHYIERFGRSFEFGLATRYYLTRKPGELLGLGPLGVRMFRHGRLHLRPKRIDQLDQLRTMLEKARELGGAA